MYHLIWDGYTWFNYILIHKLKILFQLDLIVIDLDIFKL